ncbi:type II secretion system F family protein [Salirhabdus sp. Marseille-P4669]|uniref:type II secretion system F family protein n=1 Tax=Salirhabdus sp. Marseille-P4669 TaxID=2042310 RepID=UPI000C7BFF5F|nr:type II secretion system F family protein [Salirhabdus sp. Marseille-P4669]
MFFLFVFIASTLSVGAIGTIIMNKNKRIEKRIETFINQEPVANDTMSIVGENRNKDKSLAPRILRTFSKYFKGKRFSRKWEVTLEQSGIPLKPEEFLSIRIVAAVILFFITLVLKMSGLFVLILPGLGWILPVLYVQSKGKKRIQACSTQLPQALGTLSTAMKSGFSFLQAMQIVSKEVDGPLGTEFAKTIREMNLGISTEEAFQNLLHRLPNKDLKIVVTAVIIQKATGGNLAKLFETIEETINERIRIKDELRTLTSQGKMSAWVITLLPIVIGLLLNVISPDYFQPMITHPLGIVLLILGCLSGLIGWVIIQKIVRIEV